MSPAARQNLTPNFGAESEYVEGHHGSRSNRARDAKTHRQAEADLVVANMSWSKFEDTTAGVCQRYGNKCWAPRNMRLTCSEGRNYFQPLVCVQGGQEIDRNLPVQDYLICHGGKVVTSGLSR